MTSIGRDDVHRTWWRPYSSIWFSDVMTSKFEFSRIGMLEWNRVQMCTNNAILHNSVLTYDFYYGLLHMVFLKLFLRLPVVLSSIPLKILEGFCGGIHSNRMHVIRNDLICFIEEGLFCPYYGRKTNRIWNYIFQRGQSSMVAIGPGRLCLVKIYVYKRTNFWLKMI